MRRRRGKKFKIEVLDSGSEKKALLLMGGDQFQREAAAISGKK